MKVSVCVRVKYAIYGSEYSFIKRLVGRNGKACNDEGIDVHFYFSVMDWSHPIIVTV